MAYETLEQNQAPDLLEAYADREATVFGVTATLKALGDMCPIDLNDPRVTQDAKNEFVIKIANESGLEIAPEHEAIFTEATDRLGLEPKFTIAAIEKSPSTERDAPEIQLPAAEKTVTPDTGQQQKTEVAGVHLPDEREAAALQAQLSERQYQKATKVVEEFSDSAAVDIPKPLAESAPVTALPKPIEMYTRQASESAAEQIIYETELVIAEPELNQVATLLPATEQHAGELTVDTVEEPVSLVTETVAVHDRSEASIEAVTQSWADELSKEPTEIYDDFTTALANFANADESFDEQIELGERAATLTAEEEATKQVAQVIVDRLTELDLNEKQQAAEIIKNIVGAVHGLGLLETQDADAELVEQVRTQLRELASNLGVLLGLELDEQDVEYFVRAISQLEFGENKIVEAEVLDLETVGTHEAKLVPRFLGSGFADEDFASKALGMFTLLCAGLHTKTLNAA